MEKILSRLQRFYKNIPDKKQYVEFITALLTVPVLLTVLVTNLSSIKEKDAKNTVGNPTPIIITTKPDTTNLTQSPTESPLPTLKECDKTVPNVAISDPQEGATISDNPVSIAITYDKSSSCAIVWSYRISGGRWSDYDDKSIALYNVPDGPVTFELRVKNLASGQEKILKRTFTYISSETPTPTLSAQSTVTSSPAQN